MVGMFLGIVVVSSEGTSLRFALPEQHSKYWPLSAGQQLPSKPTQVGFSEHDAGPEEKVAGVASALVLISVATAEVVMGGDMVGICVGIVEVM